MTKRRRQRSEAQLAVARRGREAQAAAASSHNAAAIVLAMAGVPASAPRAPYPPPSGALIAPPPHRCSRTGHCSCSRCSGRRDGDWWKSCHSTSTSPTRREATRRRRSSLPPDVCTDAHGTHAQLAPDCAVGQAASAASAAPIEPSTSAAQQPASPVRPLSACHYTRPVACACARSTGLRPGYGCSPAMPNWLRMPAMLKALRRKTRGTCRHPPHHHHYTPPHTRT